MEDLKDTQDFDENSLPDVVPLDASENSSDDGGNWYVFHRGDKSNYDSSPPVYVKIK